MIQLQPADVEVGKRDIALDIAAAVPANMKAQRDADAEVKHEFLHLFTTHPEMRRNAHLQPTAIEVDDIPLEADNDTRYHVK